MPFKGCPRSTSLEGGVKMIFQIQYFQEMSISKDNDIYDNKINFVHCDDNNYDGDIKQNDVNFNDDVDDRKHVAAVPHNNDGKCI
jgi:hypothetical protein